MPTADDAVLEDEGYVARIFATRAQVRAMAARGAEAVTGGVRSASSATSRWTLQATSARGGTRSHARLGRA